MSKTFWVATCVWFSHVVVQSQFNDIGNCTVDPTDFPELQTGINNYVIDTLGATMPFAYAINQCTATNVINVGKWYKYQCDMDTSSGMPTVTKTEYFDDACATSGIIIQTFNDTNMTDGNLGSFECSGENTYAKTIWSLDADCGDEVVIYAALGACTNIQSGLQLNFYCSSNETIGQVFNLGLQIPSTTSLPSFNATLPSMLNTSMTTTSLSLNATLPSLLNATLPSLLNFSLTTTSLSFNATFPMLNMTTTQFASMMCADNAFCDRWIFSSQCQKITVMQMLGDSPANVYGRMEECGTEVGGQSSTMIETTDLNITVTEPTIGSSSTTGVSSSSTTSTMENTSNAIRPSFVFTIGVLLSFFFLISV